MTKEKNTFIKNIYYMLAYAFSSLRQLDLDEKIAKEDFENIYDLFSAILSGGIGRQLKQGLYREYINRTEDLPVMRGRIDMPGTMRNRTERKVRLSCEFDELSENNLLNRILKTTVMLLLRQAEIKAEFRDELKKEMLFFSGVEELDPKRVKFSSIRFQRNNQSYRILILICQLILEGMLLTTESGEYRLASFMDDQKMNRLYEKFILEYYVREHPEIDANASKIPWALDDGEGALLPAMQSDVTLCKGNTVLIIDAKFYSRTTQTQYDVQSIHSNNLYQIFTYVKNRDAEFTSPHPPVSGMLLYAKTDEEIQPDNVYQMSGNKISVRTLDLNREFSELAGQLDEIAKEHFGEG